MLKVKDIYKSYGSLNVLSSVSFFLEQGQKVALVGPNGVGKTTLLRILAGLEESDAGKIEISKNARIGYLSQDTSLVGKETIIDYLRRTTGIDLLEKKMEELLPNIDDPTIAHKYYDAQEQYQHLDGYSFSHRAEVILSGFGLDGVGIDRNLSELSSGQKNKVALTGILLRGVDLLLLDEPTNNLDLPALIWLEDFLQKSEAACIIISHDRRFLDRVVKKIFELDWRSKTLAITGGTYTDYLEMKIKNLRRAKEEYRIQQEEIKRLSEQAREKRADAQKGARWAGTDNDTFLRGFKRDRAGKSGRTAKAIEKRIDQMEKKEKPVERDPFEISLEAEKNPGTLNIRLNNVITVYPNGFGIGPISLEVRYGNRVGIMGLNGSGKSTLLKTITGQLDPLSGTVEIGSGIKIGNMMQEHETLPKEQSLLTFLREKTELSEQHSYAKLAKFGFDERQVKQLIGTLSPGGRARLLLAYFSALSVNVLILDEPTNHLDIEAMEALEETLKSYDGTIFLVSHDRYFLEKTNPDFTYVLSDGMLTGISDYREYVVFAEERARKLIKLL